MQILSLSFLHCNTQLSVLLPLQHEWLPGSTEHYSSATHIFCVTPLILADIRVHLQYFIVSSLHVCWLPVTWLHSCSSVFVWDLRQMAHKKPKCLFSWKFEKSVSSAYYSPLTGNRLLLTSMDDRLRCEHSRRSMLVSSGSNLRFPCC